MPGEQKVLSVAVNISFLLQRDFTTALSKDIWVRSALYQSTGDPTEEESQELIKQSHLLKPMEYAKVQATLLNKYAPLELTHGTLYKLEKPKAGESSLVLEPIKAPF